MALSVKLVSSSGNTLIIQLHRKQVSHRILTNSLRQSRHHPQSRRTNRQLGSLVISIHNQGIQPARKNTIDSDPSPTPVVTSLSLLFLSLIQLHLSMLEKKYILNYHFSGTPKSKKLSPQQWKYLSATRSIWDKNTKSKPQTPKRHPSSKKLPGKSSKPKWIVSTLNAAP